jgi:outer membrane protein insertion porin family
LGRVLLLAFFLWLPGSTAFAQSQSQPPPVEPAGGLGNPEAAPAPTLLVVFPFQVHSRRPIQYLTETLPSLLAARLEATGKISVVDSAQVVSALEGRDPAELSDRELRALLRQFGAEGAVVASITELAGRYSFDVQITPVAEGLASRTLSYVAQGEEELVARLVDFADQVVAVVSGADPDRIIGLQVEGARNMEPVLRELILSKAGTPYDPDLVQADRMLLESQPGIAQVNTSIERRSSGVVLTFGVILSEALVVGGSALDGSGVVVAQVRIRGNRRIESDAIRGRIQTRAGDPLNRARIAADVREVQALGFFQDVFVYSEKTPEGTRLIFEVEENPVIRDIEITGNENIDLDDVNEILTLTTGSTLDYPLLLENEERISQLYRQRGYYLVEVDFSVTPVSEGSISVEFTIEENEKLKLRKIRFKGNHALSDAELLKGFETKTYKWYSLATSWLDKTGTYAEPIFLRDLHGVEKRYTDLGYLQVEVSQPEVDATEEGLFVTIEISEGPQFWVGEIDVVGDETMDLDALRDKIRLAEGEIFNRSYLSQDVESLERHYSDRGFFLASVQPGTRLLQDEHKVNVQFIVEKGPLYFVRSIHIAGNTRTIDPVIRREMKIVEGQLYSARGIQLSTARIQRLGFFEDVTFNPKPTEDPSQLDLNINVVERPTGSFSFGAGYSSRDGLVFTASLAQSNLFGRGYFVNLSVDVGGRTSRYNVSLSDPYFMGSTYSFSGSVFVTDVSFESFKQFQQGINFSIGHSLSEDNSSRAAVSYQWRKREVRQPTGVNASAPIFRELLHEGETASILGISFMRDTRNDRFAATAGTNLVGTVEYAGLGGFSRFFRAEMRGAWYIRPPRFFPDRSTFVLSSRIGYALPLNQITDWNLLIDDTTLCDNPSGCENVARLDQIDANLRLPLTERYFLGGIGPFQLRGYRARSLGPRRAILQRTGITGEGNLFHPVGTSVEYDSVNDRFVAICNDSGVFSQGNGNGRCNRLNTSRIDDFADIAETDVVGGNSFISSSLEYRFGISDSVGLMGVLFVDGGNAFYEGQNLFDVTQWRYGYGGGVLWFSPFGPLQLVLGFPVNPRSFEESPVFEFSVGGFGL